MLPSLGNLLNQGKSAGEVYIWLCSMFRVLKRAFFFLLVDPACLLSGSGISNDMSKDSEMPCKRDNSKWGDFRSISDLIYIPQYSA